MPWKTNRIVSYDIRNGSQLWSVGGADTLEGFRLPLAGSYFMGVPTVEGDELFVVAGQGDEIRLWSLDRMTGAPRWSRLIAYSDTKIEQDIGRRWHGAFVSSSGGILYCPTSVGWFIAVDRLTQSVIWTYRYSPVMSSEDREEVSRFVPADVLSTQWPPAAPIVSGNVVVFTPPEEPLIVALNAIDGRKLWQFEKEDWSYLAGVTNDLVVMVGKTETRAFELQTGKSRWSVSHGQGAVPSGRGLFVGDHFYLPLNNGELQILEVSSGRRISQSFVSNGTPLLGNLAMHRGRLVSISPQCIMGFGQRDVVVEEIATRLTQNPEDAKSLLEQAEIAILDRKYDSALGYLKSLSVDQLSPSERSRHHKGMIEALSALVRSNPADHEKELSELAHHVKSIEEQFLLLELTSDRLVSERRLADAFDVLWSWVEREDSSSAFVQRIDDPHVWVHRSRWIAGRLLEVWEASSETERQSIDSRIRSIIGLVATKPKPVRLKTSKNLSFHPASIPIREAIIDE
ncbi:MAG: hypothetical protein FJ267_11525, partial [Planctomycetes bacterium]|nr:hypothetical protein [Planctomycetota bacterium]